MYAIRSYYGQVDIGTGSLANLQPAAEVAGGVVAHLLAATVEGGLVQPQHVLHERAEVDDLVRELGDLGGQRLVVLEQLGVAVLEVRGAGGAQGDDVVVVSRITSYNVCYTKLLRFAIP